MIPLVDIVRRRNSTPAAGRLLFAVRVFILPTGSKTTFRTAGERSHPAASAQDFERVLQMTGPTAILKDFDRPTRAPK